MSLPVLPFSADQLVNVATGQRGVSESPPGSNRTRYGRETGLDGVAWCAIFLGWCFRQLGADFGLWLGTTSWRWTPSILAAGRRAGDLVPVEQARRGDVVLFDWPDGTPRPQHVEIVVSHDAGELVCVGGNAGRNGQVMIQTRRPSDVVGVIRPRFGGTPAHRPPAPPAPAVVRIGGSIPVAVDGEQGPESWSAVQAHVGLRGRQIDGIPGPITWRAVQAHVGLRGRQLDGIPGPITWAHVQRHVNAGLHR